MKKSKIIPRFVDDTPISSPGCEYQFGIFPSGKGCFASYTKCANGVPSEVSQTIFSVGTSTLAQVYCQLGLAYDHRIHTCNWPDLLMEYAGQTFFWMKLFPNYCVDIVKYHFCRM